MQKMMVKNSSDKEKQEKDMRKLDAEMLERASRVDGLIQDIEARLKTVEEELNDEDPAEGDDHVEGGLEKGPGETA